MSCLLCCLRITHAVNLYFLLDLLGGALKPTDIDQLWVHVMCAWYQPKVSFPVEETMEPAMGILSIPSEYFKKVRIFIWYFLQGYLMGNYCMCFCVQSPYSWLNSVFFVNSRHVSYASRCMGPAPSATSVLLIIMQYVHQELDIAWR